MRARNHGRCSYRNAGDYRPPPDWRLKPAGSCKQEQGNAEHKRSIGQNEPAQYDLSWIERSRYRSWHRNLRVERLRDAVGK